MIIILLFWKCLYTSKLMNNNTNRIQVSVQDTTLFKNKTLFWKSDQDQLIQGKEVFVISLILLNVYFMV